MTSTLDDDSTYHDAAWFQAGQGDVVFAQWLLDRCWDLSDIATPPSSEASQKVVSWSQLRQRVETQHDGGGREDAGRSRPRLLVGGRLQELQTSDQNPRIGDSPRLESDVVAEVLESTTELLVSQATREDEETLWEWLGVLEEAGDWDDKSRAAGEEATERVEAFLEFLDQSFPFLGDNKVAIPTVTWEMEMSWASTMQQIQRMSEQEEANREAVARDSENLLQYDYGLWPECTVEVFGSSKSLYGSVESDLDMCVLTTGPSAGNKLPTELLGFYYLKRLIERTVWDDDRVRMTTAERVEQLKKMRSQVLEGVRRLYSSKVAKQRPHAQFFDSHMQQLIDALGAELDVLYWESRSRRGAIKTPRTALNEKLLRTSKRRKNELFDLKSIFESEPGYKIQAVASHARVPVIRFRYMQGGLDYKCDLCFDNELGVRNTRLLRAYASFDERARELGLAIKYWAKQRGITDTASGFLSSYSYVLLSIYYLQVVDVLPNLQDSRLVELAEVPPEYYDGVSIAFCEDRDIAQVFHEQTSAENDSENSLDASLPSLLMGFFEFYAAQFDYLNHVVAIRSPDRLVPKVNQWGNKAKTWRMSIQDPLQTSRDVGGVLHFNSQRKITHELCRAHEMLEQGESFLDAVCLRQDLLAKPA